MIRKILEITSEGIHYLFFKAHKFEKQLIMTINDTINNNNTCKDNLEFSYIYQGNLKNLLFLEYLRLKDQTGITL